VLPSADLEINLPDVALDLLDALVALQARLERLGTR